MISFVGDPIAFVGVYFALIGDPVSVVGGHVPFCGGLVTLVRAEGRPFFDESATCVGGQLSEEVRDASPGDCADALGSGELVEVMRFALVAELLTAFTRCASTWLVLTVAQLHGERPCICGSLVQILSGIQPCVHFGGFTASLPAGMTPSLGTYVRWRRDCVAPGFRKLLAPTGQVCPPMTRCRRDRRADRCCLMSLNLGRLQSVLAVLVRRVGSGCSARPPSASFLAVGPLVHISSGLRYPPLPEAIVSSRVVQRAGLCAARPPAAGVAIFGLTIDFGCSVRARSPGVHSADLVGPRHWRGPLPPAARACPRMGLRPVHAGQRMASKSATVPCDRPGGPR
ncbi:hypothetical protein F4554_005919 [Actinopolymorpha rutila]|uniref:Uncharacterized protein n=1 Tax=Actinopolymorpha rutila TaxID=446787 RepID=A0A852ZJL4_9ACTN|nr:hypothetical protein [Actinopolymorpha rutila]